MGELNAGLTLPPPKKSALTQSLPNTVLLVEKSKSSSQLAESSKSKNKLKFLMGKADPPKRGGLQDFMISSVQTINFHKSSPPPPPPYKIDSSCHVFLGMRQLLRAHDDVVDGLN